MIAFSLPTILSYAGIQSLIHAGARNSKDRQWGLSVFNSTLMSVYGLLYLLNWLFTHDLTATAMTDRVVYQLQAYLVVDLIYNGFINTETRHSVLEFWAHHSIYSVLCGLAIQYDVSGLAVVYMIMEVPAAIRGIGTIQPEWRSDAGFGLSFFLLRILLPFVFVFHDGHLYPLVFKVAFAAMQTLHCYWFYRWCCSQLPRLLGGGGNPTV